jgi:SAM-dependent methyltransferase
MDAFDDTPLPDVQTRLTAMPAFRRAPSLDDPMPLRYQEWFFAAKAAGLAGVEQLVPYIEVPPGPTRAAAAAWDNDDADGAEALLRDYPPETWGYYLPLSRDYGTLGERVTMTPARRHSQRRSDYRLNMIWRGIEALSGGSVVGRSVLDIACNWGGFAVEARLRGAGPVSAFDIRPENIAKARRVAAHFGVGDIAFSVADALAFDPGVQFDIVLNLGLMYHVADPVQLMRRTYALTRDIAVIDTVVHREAFSGFVLGTGGLAPSAHAATAVGLELHPTYRGLLDLARLVGFREIVEIIGLPSPEYHDFATEPYGLRQRRCIVCAR